MSMHAHHRVTNDVRMVALPHNRELTQRTECIVSRMVHVLQHFDRDAPACSRAMCWCSCIECFEYCSERALTDPLAQVEPRGRTRQCRTDHHWRVPPKDVSVQNRLVVDLVGTALLSCCAERCWTSAAACSSNRRRNHWHSGTATVALRLQLYRGIRSSGTRSTSRFGSRAAATGPTWVAAFVH